MLYVYLSHNSADLYAKRSSSESKKKSKYAGGLVPRKEQSPVNDLENKQKPKFKKKKTKPNPHNNDSDKTGKEIEKQLSGALWNVSAELW